MGEAVVVDLQPATVEGDSAAEPTAPPTGPYSIELKIIGQWPVNKVTIEVEY